MGSADLEIDYVKVSRRSSEFDINWEKSVLVADINRTEDSLKLLSKEVYTASAEIGITSLLHLDNARLLYYIYSAVW